MVELNQNLLVGLLIGLIVGFVGHSLIAKSFRIMVVIIAIVILVWIFYFNSWSS